MAEQLFEHEKYYISHLSELECKQFFDHNYILDSKCRSMVFQRFNKYIYSPTKRELEVANLKYHILEKCKKISNNN